MNVTPTAAAARRENITLTYEVDASVPDIAGLRFGITVRADDGRSDDERRTVQVRDR